MAYTDALRSVGIAWQAARRWGDAVGVVTALARRIHAGYLAAEISLYAGDVALELDRADSAVRAFERGVREARRAGERYMVDLTTSGLIAALAADGQVERARTLLAERVARPPALHPMEQLTLQALLAESEGDMARAHRLYLGALRESGVLRNPDEVPVTQQQTTRWAILHGSAAALAAGDPAAADSLARQALVLLRRTGHDDARAVQPLIVGLGPDYGRTRAAEELLRGLP